MHSTDTLVVVGASHAGVELSLAARLQGWLGAIVLLGEESAVPYHRPPLSKAWLSGDATIESMALRPAKAFETNAISLRLGSRVQAIDRAACTVQLDDGSTLAYSCLALCTGGRPRELHMPGLMPNSDIATKPANLHYLRTQADGLAIRAGLVPQARLVIIGAGYIGLEVAASARKLGATVTVLEAESRVLSRVTGPQLSAFYESVHREAGVDIRTATKVQRIECGDGGAVQAVICADGTRIEADQLVVGVGMLPNIELAVAAGLHIDGGIVVNALSQTSDPLIVAAGDCTVHHSELYGRRIRLESVPNALEQARAAASALCGKPKPNHGVPWFWSDQYALKLQMAGLSNGYDNCVLRGSVAARSFSAFYLRKGQLLAADAVNRPADFLFAKQAIVSRLVLDASALADETISLKSLMPLPVATPAVNASPASGPG